MIERLKELFKDRIIRYNRLDNLINILKTDKECYDYCVSIFEKEKCFKNLKEVLIYLIDDIEIRKCKTCGKNILFEKVLEYKRHNREINYCDRKCAPNNFQFKYLKKHKVDYINPFSKEEVKKKIKETNLKRYGCENPSSNEMIKAKKKVSMKKYTSSMEFKIKCFNSFSRFKDYVIPMFKPEEYEGIFKEYKWKCVKCGNVFTQKIHSTNHVKHCQEVPRCLKCYPYLNVGISQKEKEVVEFCKQYFNNIIENDRTLINPYELDIVIPDRKLAIEFNGIYFHSIESGTPHNYHLMKTQMCEVQNYRLIHIFEDEWNDNKEEIKFKLKQIFENKEIIDYSKLLDRCWVSTLQLTDKKFDVLAPEIKNKDGFLIENCGYLMVKND